MAAVFLVLSDDTSQSVLRGLETCAKAIIPSLFPYMVVSSMLTKTGAGSALGKIFSHPAKYLFKFSPESATAVILGAFCGFPVGAVTAIELYSNGDISKDEAERLLPVCNNTGPAFLIGVIGALYWNSKLFGAVLYLIQILISVLLGIIASRKTNIAYNESKTCSFSESEKNEKHNFLSQLSSSISSASINMITVCGFVIFFSVIIDLIIPLFELISPDGYLGASVISLLEFSSASKYASFLPYPPLSAAFTAFAVGWAGISVHSQVMSFSLSSKCSLNMTKYYKYKFIQGVICGIICFFYAIVSGISPSTEAFAGSLSFSSPLIYFSNIIFLSGFAVSFRKKLTAEQNMNTN